ncbi:MAG: cyclic nucleotide-binding domain-containing protein [Nitrospirae bacterium]|uniref:cyclic nucleotide-binding domain-containing protein n=1 Tax=Candidatus Magnetominusculus dajiuhuensis TaxID=3137712 RepID=UPI001A03F922|nr:cyclic nucleotide-binding domain-containing protein [Nitrospirota bacterium]
MDKKLSILIVIHRDIAVRDVTKGTLRYIGYSIINTVNDPKNVVEFLLREKCDLIIIDYDSIENSKIDVLSAIRSNPALGNKRIVLLYKDDLEASSLKQLYNDGVSSILKFPFQMTDVQKSIADATRSESTVVAETYAKIRQLDFFSFMTDEDIVKLLRMSKLRRYKTDEFIFDEGDSGDRFYVIVDGSISIYKQLEDGKIERLAELNRGECFGEMALLEDSTRSARAVANEDIMLFELDKAIMNSYDDIITLKLYKKFAYIFSERLRRADKKIRDLALYSYKTPEGQAN